MSVARPTASAAAAASGAASVAGVEPPTVAASKLGSELRKLGSELHTLEDTSARLKQEIDALTEQHAACQREVEVQRQRLKELQLVVPEPDEVFGLNPDDVLELDVGGQVFRVLRSTLSQFEGSALAELASTGWAGAAKFDDGRIFLDLDPSAFNEILTFLRERRLFPGIAAHFSPEAARLAGHLGVPVGSTVGETHISFEAWSPYSSWFTGLVFDLSMRGQWGCILRAVSCQVGKGPSTLTIRALKGSCCGPSAVDKSQWLTICQEEVKVGLNRIVLPWSANVSIAPFGTLALSFFCRDGDGELQGGSDTHTLKCRSSYVDLSRATVGELRASTRLIVHPGREADADGQPCPGSRRVLFDGVVEYELD